MPAISGLPRQLVRPTHDTSSATPRWGWGAFAYDAASDRFRPFTVADSPPQETDAKCHTVVKNRDYVFTEYGHR